MATRKREEDFYEEFSEKFKKYISSYLSDDINVYYSCNKYLPEMIEDIKRQFNITNSDTTYIPKLKLDILFGLKRDSESYIRYLLLEVKYDENY